MLKRSENLAFIPKQKQHKQKLVKLKRIAFSKYGRIHHHYRYHDYSQLFVILLT